MHLGAGALGLAVLAARPRVHRLPRPRLVTRKREHVVEALHARVARLLLAGDLLHHDDVVARHDGREHHPLARERLALVGALVPDRVLVVVALVGRLARVRQLEFHGVEAAHAQRVRFDDALVGVRQRRSGHGRGRGRGRGRRRLGRLGLSDHGRGRRGRRGARLRGFRLRCQRLQVGGRRQLHERGHALFQLIELLLLLGCRLLRVVLLVGRVLRLLAQRSQGRPLLDARLLLVRLP